jgi:hypothetical protein
MRERLADHMERAWVITCSRCKNEGLSYSQTKAESERWFAGQGWRFVYWSAARPSRLLCPTCVEETNVAGVLG